MGDGNKKLPMDNELTVAGLVPKIEKLRLYCGHGGEIMKSATSILIDCLSIAKVALNVKQEVQLLDSLDENLKHLN